MLRPTSALALGLLLSLGVLGCSDSPEPPTAGVPEGLPPITMTDGEPCGQTQVVTLYAGQYIDVGTVTVSNDETTLTVRFDTTGGWVMTETHLAVAASLDEIPQTGSGNPKVGQFLYSSDQDPSVTTFSYEVPLDSYVPGDELYIAAHAAVVLTDENGDPVQEETAWADGLDFSGNNWATYVTYGVQECDGLGGGDE